MVKMELIESLVELRDCLFDVSGVWAAIWAHVCGGGKVEKGCGEEGSGRWE